ncbi:MAG: hypothetical protein KDB26_02470 [Microthrixaceae bacterium]|nr:hypothetical protein [Microthrixaceae bacterium]
MPVQPTEDRRSIRLSRNQTIIVLASMFVVAAVAAIAAISSPPTYETTRNVMVVSGANPNDNEVVTQALQSIVESKGFAAEVKRRGDLPQSIDEINGMISVKRKPDSAFMSIVVKSPDREESEQVSAQVVPALTSAFESAQRDLPVESRIRGPIFQEVLRPLQSTSRFPLWFAVVFGLLLGGLVPFLYFLARNLTKPVLESSKDVIESIELPVLARVGALSARGTNPQDTIAGVISSIERLALNEPVHRLVLVGSDAAQERAELALALACTIARSFGQPVALIDADLDEGVLTTMLGADGTAGLAECLAGQLNPEATLTSLGNVSVPRVVEPMRPPDGMVRFLGAGVDTSRNILRMRSNFARVLEALAGRFVVIVNGPRVPGPVPTAQMLSLADATLMVVNEGATTLTDARAAGDTLRSFGSGASGVVVLRS